MLNLLTRRMSLLEPTSELQCLQQIEELAEETKETERMRHGQNLKLFMEKKKYHQMMSKNLLTR